MNTAVDGMGRIESSVMASADVVKKLGENSRQIGQIVEAISAISEQTNLLALNAAIEADRAGEHGFFMRDFSLRVNSLVLVFGDKLKVGNVVVVFVEVAVMNFVTVGNFAVKVRPNETMKSD